MKENYLTKTTFLKTETSGFSHVKNNVNNHLTGIFILLFGVFGMTNAFGQSPSNFTTTGNWIAPAGVTSVTVEAYGAGGAGGAGLPGGGNNGRGGGGGGGGAFQSGTYDVTPGNSYIINVGVGGTGGAGNGGNGTASTATFDSGSITADFGRGGRSYANGGNGGIGGTGTRNGGTGGSNPLDANGSGGGGGCAGTTGNGGNGGQTAGGAAGTGGTIAGAGANGVGGNNAGNDGNNFGGGGSGGTRAGAGGDGAGGYVRITFTCPTFNAGPDQTLATCATTTTLAAAALPVGATGAWTVIAGSATVTTLTSPTSGVTAIVPGTSVTLRWTVTNGACGSSFDDVVITSPVGPGCLSYCTPTFTSGVEPISNVTFNTINNSSPNVCNAGAQYENFTAISTTVIKSSTYTLNVTGNTCGNFINNIRVYFDWNIDGDFNDPGESYDLGTIVNNANGLATLSITIPAGASTGAVRMRVMKRFGGYPTSACQTGAGFGQAEDYTINIVDPAPCVAPTAQPTALNLSPSGTNISGSFTAASPASDSYLVLISTNPAPPAAPVNGTTYPIGSTYQAGYTVVDNDSNTNFNATGLLTLTTYYFYIYSFNGLCTGGPLYVGASPLTGNATTLVASYCVPSSTNADRYIVDVFTTGNITNLSNLGTGYSPTGYADYTALPPVTQIPGGGVAIDYYLQLSRQNVKIWVDWNNDGIFTDAAPELVYQTGGTVTIAGAGGFIVPPATLPGNYRIRIRTSNEGDAPDFPPCGVLTRGETEDYTLTVVADCPAKPNAINDGDRCGSGTVVLGVEGTPGVTEFRFYDSLFGGTLIGTAPAVVGITNWTTPALAATTNYYVTAFNGVCESWYRQKITATINPVANVVVTPSVPDVCGENNIVQISAGGDFVIDYLVNEDFEGGGFGVLNRVSPNANADTQWTNRTGPYVPEGSVWKPAITSNAIGNRFAVANSDFATPNPKDTQLRTANLDASAFSDLFLSFRHYFSYYPGEPVQFADVDVSDDGGGTWTNIASYTSNQGFAGEFANVTIDLSAYAGQPQVMVRFRFHLAGGSAWADGWALDDVQVYGTRPLNTTFTWSGGTVDAFIDAGCTIPYVAQAVTTVYVRPTALQLASPSWSFTATATLGNGCPISEFITITNSTKLWIGNISDDWFNPNNWEPVGVPDINTCIFIYDGTFDANINNTGNDAFGKTLTVRPSGFLQIQPDNNLTIDEAVTVDAGGTFNIENSGSLIQIANVANSGTITMRRNATLKALDYVYWSTPVAGFASSAISPLTPTGLIWKWEPTTVTAYAGDFGNWVNGSEAMTTGRGYIVRSPSGWPAAPSVFTANFVGVPNNGTINRAITRSTYTGPNYVGPTTTEVTANDDNWNLLGNPYPSAISAVAFLTANAAHINGFLDLWTHGNAPAAIADPFYQDYQLNYNPNDYLRYNSTGGTQFGFDGYIGAGQGFFVLMNDAGGTTENVVFNNAMRSNGFRNDQFFRSADNEVTSILERHRIWLKMVAPSGSSSDMLVGYITGATNTLDNAFDAMNRGVKVNFELYSLNENKGLSIQGRSLPFDTTDQIPLGIAVQENGIHTIAIASVDGLFTDSNQNIYLEDLVLNVTHDLRAAPYTFTATQGRYENRFVLRYTNETLGNDDFISTNSVKVYTNNTINVTASSNIKSVTVYDLLGRTLGAVSNVNNTDVSLNGIAKTQSTLVVIVELENGVKTTQKVIF